MNKFFFVVKLKGMNCLELDGWQDDLKKELIFACGFDIKFIFQSTADEHHFDIEERGFIAGKKLVNFSNRM